MEHHDENQHRHSLHESHPNRSHHHHHSTIPQEYPSLFEPVPYRHDRNDSTVSKSRHYEDERIYVANANRTKAFSRVTKEQNDAEYLRVPVPMTEQDAEDQLEVMFRPRQPKAESNVKHGACWECLFGEKACGSKEYALCEELNDLENQAYLFFKLMSLKSIQMILAACFSFAVLIDWKFEDKLENYPILVKLAQLFYWSIYIAIVLYVAIRVAVRLTHFNGKRWACFIVYFIQTILVTLIVFMSGAIWVLIFPTAIALTLGLSYFILGLLPLIKETMDIKKGCIQYIAAILVAMLSFGSWFVLNAVFASCLAKVSMVYFHDSIYNKIYLHCFPVFIVSEIFVLVDLAIIQNIFRGGQFPLFETSWALIAVYA